MVFQLCLLCYTFVEDRQTLWIRGRTALNAGSALTLEQLAVFLRVCELGNLSRTAAALDRTQPALSRQIGALETALGVTLFHRTGRGVTPTRAGERLRVHAREILEAVSAAKDDVRDSASVLTGGVRIGVTPMVAQIMTGPLVIEVNERYPELRIEVLEGPSVAVTEWVSAGVIDLAIMYKPPMQFRESADSEMLLHEPLCLIGKAPHIDDAPVDFDALTEIPLVLPSATNGMRRRLDEIARERGSPLTVATEIDSYATILSMLRSGAAFTVLPALAVHEDLAAGQLIAAPIVRPQVSAHLSLYSTRAHPLRQAPRKLIQLIHELATSLSESIAGTDRSNSPA